MNAVGVEEDRVQRSQQPEPFGGRWQHRGRAARLTHTILVYQSAVLLILNVVAPFQQPRLSLEL